MRSAGKHAEPKSWRVLCLLLIWFKNCKFSLVGLASHQRTTEIQAKKKPKQIRVSIIDRTTHMANSQSDWLCKGDIRGCLHGGKKIPEGGSCLRDMFSLFSLHAIKKLFMSLALGSS